MYLRLASLVLLLLSVVCDANAGGRARPSRTFRGVGIGTTVLSPHPTLPFPILLFQAREVGNYTHFGKSTIITTSGDFNTETGKFENGKSVATAADRSTANATWSAQAQPDGIAVLTVRWSGGTKRFTHFAGETTILALPLNETTFENHHSGKVSY